MNARDVPEEERELNGEEARLEMEIALLRSKMEKVRMKKQAIAERKKRGQDNQAAKTPSVSSSMESSSREGGKLINKKISRGILKGGERMATDSKKIDPKVYRQHCGDKAEPPKPTESAEKKIAMLLEKASAEERQRILANKKALSECGIRAGGASVWRDPLTLLDDMRGMQMLQDELVKGNLSSFIKIRNETSKSASDFIIRELKKTKKQGGVETPKSCSNSIQHGKEEVDRTVLDNLFKSRDASSKDASTSVVLIEDLGEATPK